MAFLWVIWVLLFFAVSFVSDSVSLGRYTTRKWDLGESHQHQNTMDHYFALLSSGHLVLQAQERSPVPNIPGWWNPGGLGDYLTTSMMLYLHSCWAGPLLALEQSADREDAEQHGRGSREPLLLNPPCHRQLVNIINEAQHILPEWFKRGPG